METNAPDFKDRDAFDPNERELCPDGACTGLIGVDGKCKVCGQAGAAAAGGRSVSRQSAIDETLPPEGAAGVGGDETAGDREAGASDHEDAGDGHDPDDDRELCSDGACTGLIGSDGKCKVCGRSAAS